MRALVYTRISLSSDDLATTRQEEDCRALCQARGYEVAEVYTDQSLSATAHRPAYERLLKAVEGRRGDVVVVYRLDRLLRRLVDLEALIDLLERTGVQLVTVQGDLDLTNAQGRLLGRILASVARSEVEVKGERQKRANSQRAAMGKPHGSRRPYGYEIDLVTVRDCEAEALRQMADKIIRGWGLNETAAWANSQGYVTTTGRPFLGVTICNMLRKPRYAGIRTHNGVEYPAAWEAVFDTQTWERLQLAMKLRSEKNVPKARKYLLTGLLDCGRCGGHMNGSRKQDRPGLPYRRTYVCIDCRKIRRNADALDWFVRESVLYRLDSPEMSSLLQPQDDGQLRELLELRQMRASKLDSLVDDYAAGLLTREQFARAKATAEALLAETQAALDSACRVDVGSVGISAGHNLRTAWAENSTDWRRGLVEVLVKKITVNPCLSKPYVDVDGVRMRFSPEGVDVSWRA